MNETKTKTADDFTLPTSVVSKVDVSRLVNELERVDNELTSISVHEKTGLTAQSEPEMSQSLRDFLTNNQCSIQNSTERSALIKQLRLLKDKLPVIHMTFSVVADRESLQEIAQWLRSSVHPQAVISVGLQPALVAGVYLRTPNHVHDFSLRAQLKNGHGLLVKELGALRGNS